MLMHGVARRTSHGDQTFLSLQAKAKKVAQLPAAISGWLSGLEGVRGAVKGNAAKPGMLRKSLGSSTASARKGTSTPDKAPAFSRSNCRF